MSQDLYSLNFFTCINALDPDLVTEKCETYDNQGWKETEPLLNARYGHATVTLDDYELNFKDFFE